MEAKDIVGLLTPALTWIIAAGFLFIWNLRRDLPTGLYLAAAYAIIGFGFGQAWVLEGIAPRLGLFLNGAFSVSAVLLLAVGVLNRMEVELNNRLLFAILLIGNLINATVLAYLPNISVSFMVMNFTAGLLVANIAMTLRKNLQQDPLDAAIFWSLSTASLFLLLQPVAYTMFARETITIATYAASVEWIALHLLTIILCSMSAMSLIMVTVSDVMRTLQREAETDGLSGLSRRGPFQRDVEAILEKTKRTPLPVSMIVCDIDNFKSINDTFGHLAGDAVIARFGQLMASSCRATDLSSRVGGEEFALLLWNADQLASRLVAEQLRTSFEAITFDEEMSGRNCTASFGITQHQPGDTFTDMFIRADRAMYQAKESGRNRVVTDAMAEATPKLIEAA